MTTPPPSPQVSRYRCAMAVRTQDGRTGTYDGCLELPPGTTWTETYHLLRARLAEQMGAPVVVQVFTLEADRT